MPNQSYKKSNTIDRSTIGKCLHGLSNILLFFVSWSWRGLQGQYSRYCFVYWPGRCSNAAGRTWTQVGGAVVSLYFFVQQKAGCEWCRHSAFCCHQIFLCHFSVNSFFLVLAIAAVVGTGPHWDKAADLRLEPTERRRGFTGRAIAQSPAARLLPGTCLHLAPPCQCARGGVPAPSLASFREVVSARLSPWLVYLGSSHLPPLGCMSHPLLRYPTSSSKSRHTLRFLLEISPPPSQCHPYPTWRVSSLLWQMALVTLSLPTMPPTLINNPNPAALASCISRLPSPHVPTTLSSTIFFPRSLSPRQPVLRFMSGRL